MKTITIYKIVEAAEKKYVAMFGKLETDELLAGWTGGLKALIAKGKEAGDDISIEDAVAYAIRIFPEEIKRPSTQADRDLVIIAAFKMACEKGGPFSADLVKIISINFMNIILTVQEKPKEKVLLNENEMTTNLQA